MSFAFQGFRRGEVSGMNGAYDRVGLGSVS